MLDRGCHSFGIARDISSAVVGHDERALNQRRVGGHHRDPLVAPGERFPHNDPAWPPRLSPRPADDIEFFQGLLEGIARIEAQGYRLLAELGAPYPATVTTVGGGARNAGWSAIRQDMLGVPLRPAHSEQASYGAALLALRAMS